jgi:hypothetical protein
LSLNFALLAVLFRLQPGFFFLEISSLALCLLPQLFALIPPGLHKCSVFFVGLIASLFFARGVLLTNFLAANLTNRL